MVGAALWLSGSNRRAALAARGRDEGGGSAIRAALERIDGALRRTRHGQRLAQWLRSSGGPLSPIDAVAIVGAGGLVLSMLLLLLVPPVAAFILGYVFIVAGLRWYVERARTKRRD